MFFHPFSPPPSLFYFFLGEAAAFFAGDLAAGVGFVFFGLGAFGFFVGAPFADFFAFDGDFGAFAAAAAAALPAFFFSTAAFFGDLAFFSPTAAAAFFLAAAVVPTVGAFFADFGRLAAVAAAAVVVLAFTAVFFALAPPSVAAAAAAAALPAAGAASLNDPLAPLPFVCTNTPDVTAFLRYLRMKGETFSASTL